jgi:hypothetical protein
MKIVKELVMTVTTLSSVAVAILLTLPYGPAHCQPPADLVMRGGRIVTLDPQLPVAEALAASGDRIVAVGSDADVQPLIGDSTRVIEPSLADRARPASPSK